MWNVILGRNYYFPMYAYIYNIKFAVYTMHLITSYFSNDEDSVDSKRRRMEIVRVYDPRYLLFEFTWNLMLRKSQVIMVKEYMQSMQQASQGMRSKIKNFFLLQLQFKRS